MEYESLNCVSCNGHASMDMRYECSRNLRWPQIRLIWTVGQPDGRAICDSRRGMLVSLKESATGASRGFTIHSRSGWKAQERSTYQNVGEMASGWSSAEKMKERPLKRDVQEGAHTHVPETHEGKMLGHLQTVGASECLLERPPVVCNISWFLWIKTRDEWLVLD